MEVDLARRSTQRSKLPTSEGPEQKSGYAVHQQTHTLRTACEAALVACCTLLAKEDLETSLDARRSASVHAYSLACELDAWGQMADLYLRGNPEVQVIAVLGLRFLNALDELKCDVAGGKTTNRIAIVTAFSLSIMTALPEPAATRVN